MERKSMVVLVLLAVLIALLVDIPMVLLNATTANRLSRVENSALNAQIGVEKLLETPSASPSATITPTPTETVKTLKGVTSVPVTTPARGR